MKVPSRGNPSAKIMLVGDAPSSIDTKLGRTFSGPPGNVLVEMLMKSGIDPEDCYYTNICKSLPPGGDLTAWAKHGIPSEQVADDLDELISEVESINPNVIVPLGAWPLHFFYGLKFDKKEGYPVGSGDYRGYVLEARKLCKGRKIIPTQHPAYYLRGQYGETGLGLFDLGKVLRESVLPTIHRRPRTYYLDPRGEERDALRARLLAEGPILFFDIEYIGHSLKCVGFAVSPDWAVTVKIRSSDDVRWIKELLECGKPLGAQNAMYDVGMLEWHYDIHCFQYLVYDTMVAAYVLNIEHKKDLGFLGALYTDLPAWWDVVDWDKIKAGTQDPDVLLEYNCQDNVATCEIAEKQQVEMARDPKYLEAFKFDMAKLPALWSIAKRGVLLDTDQMLVVQYKADKAEAEGQELLNDLCDAVDFPRKGDFNVKSPLEVPALLQHMGIELTKRTKGNKYWDSSNVQIMEYLRRSPDNRLLKRMVEGTADVREARDIKSKWATIEWDKDGRARCIYDATKTSTRRLSSKTFFPTGNGGNLQNIPAPNSSLRYGGLIRGCFVADPGFKFGYADLKGAEFFIVAELSQDTKMLEFADMTLKGTGKVHAITASYIFGGDPKDISKESPKYFLGKKMRHSGNYMVGWKELMGRINAEALDTGVWIDAKTTKLLIDGYKALHPGLPNWWDEVRYEAKSTGRLRNLFGFIRVINDRVDSCLPELVAYKPQSTVGDCLNYGLINCENDAELRDYGFSILLQVHDAIGFQYKPEYETQVLSRVEHLMTIPIYIPKTDKYLTIPIEIATGHAWHPLEDWHAPTTL